MVPFPIPPTSGSKPRAHPGEGCLDGLASPHQFFPEPSGERLTCVVRVGTSGAVSGTEAGGARVAVLGLGASRAQAADLTVRPVHHLHKLSAPAEGAEQPCSGLGLGCIFPPPVGQREGAGRGPSLLKHEEKVGIMLQQPWVEALCGLNGLPHSALQHQLLNL